MRTGLYFGRRQQGKTTLALHHALQFGGGVVIYDINRQFERFPKTTTSNFAEFDSLVACSEERIIVYRPEANPWEEFFLFSESLWKRQGYCLVIDEASQLQSAAGAHPWLDRFVRMAPPSLQVLQTLHRPRDSATLCRSLATDWFIFHTNLEHDLDVIEEQCGPEARAAVLSLREGDRVFYHWDDSHGQGQLVNDPNSWYEVK